MLPFSRLSLPYMENVSCKTRRKQRLDPILVVGSFHAVQ